MRLTAPTNALHVRHWDMNDIYARHAIGLALVPVDPRLRRHRCSESKAGRQFEREMISRDQRLSSAGVESDHVAQLQMIGKPTPSPVLRQARTGPLTRRTPEINEF